MFLGANYGNVEDIEILWTLISLFGLIFAGWNLKEAIKDRDAIKKLDRNGKILIANTAYKSELARTIKQAIFLTIGILAMTIPGIDYSMVPFKVTAINFLIRWGLLSASFLTTYQSYLSFRLRKDLLRE